MNLNIKFFQQFSKKNRDAPKKFFYLIPCRSPKYPPAQSFDKISENDAQKIRILIVMYKRWLKFKQLISGRFERSIFEQKYGFWVEI